MKNSSKIIFSLLVAISVFALNPKSIFAKGQTAANVDWKDASSLKETYVDSKIFDHFGIAVTLDELKNAEVRKGLQYQTNSFTMGNEMKPQWLLWYYSGVPSHKATFTASNGKTINVPDAIPSKNDPAHGLGGVATCLNYAKEMGIQMRGHVLTWHSQTFDWFFCKDYDITKGLVDKDEMTARHEWYIKTVLEFVAEWEKTNNGGKHIIYAWDVVNEAVADDASKKNYLRGSSPSTKNPVKLANGCNSQGDSRWYQIYGSDEFIINAFRFANKYAPKDVELCYNDYNEYMDYGGENDATHKRTGIESLLKSIIAHQNDAVLPTRIDAMGMQSHLEGWVGISAYETALKKFIALGLDIHVTELDFKYTAAENAKLVKLYSDYFKLFQRYAKSNPANKHGITSVTLWGINDENSWLNHTTKYAPLLFSKKNGKYCTKETFVSVIESAKK